jgi:hypothetical protein
LVFSPADMCFDQILIGEVCDSLHFDCCLLGTKKMDHVFV